MEWNCVIVRYGEIALKGKNKGMFERKLRENISKVLEKKKIKAKVERISGRFIVETENPEAAGIVRNIFGVTSTSPAVKIKSNVDGIKDKALEIFNEKKPGTFRVTANRLEKTLGKTSMEVNEMVGGHIQEHSGCKVSLKNPELNIGVDITRDYAYLYTGRLEGVGGLPVGVSGRVVCLFSGGIDSPVAAWLSMKRGCDVTLVHFLHEEYNKRPGKILELRERLTEYYPDIKLVFVPTREVEKELVMKVPAKLRIVVLRRLFMKIASKLCSRMNAKAIITGDNVGQVASQTLDNLNVIDEAASVLVLRPLAGYDKCEIIDLAREIGTYDTSIREYKDCCNFLLPKHPETRARLGEVEKVEEKLGTTLIDNALEKTYNA